MAKDPYFAGRQGTVGFATSSSIAATPIGKLTSFRVNVTQASIPVTNFDSSFWAENLAGERTWGVTADAMMVSTSATGPATLRSYLSTSTRIWIEVKNTSTTATAGYSFSGYGFNGGWELSGDGDSPQVNSYEFFGDGPLVESST